MKVLYLLLVFLLFGCDFEEDEAVRYLPINSKDLIYHKGDVLAFEVDSVTTGAAFVTGYLKEADDSTHIWYELVGTNYIAKQIPTIEQLRHHRVFGRKVASSLDPAGYFIGIDIESVRNDCLVENASKFRLVGQLPLDTTIINLGSQGASSDYNSFVQYYTRGIESRKIPPDHYSAYLSKMEKFRPNEYFPVSYFLVK